MVIPIPNNYLINQEKNSFSEDDIFGISRKEYITVVLIAYNANTEYDIFRRILIPQSIAKDSNFIRILIIKLFYQKWLERHIWLSADSTNFSF